MPDDFSFADPVATPVPDSSFSPEPVPTSTPAPIQTAEVISSQPIDSSLSSSKDFEIEAFKILRDSTDYNTGVNALIDQYKTSKFDNPEEAKGILETYAQNLSYKFKEDSLDPYTNPDNVIAIAPFKFKDAVGEDTVSKINDYEKKNLDLIETTDNPDLLAVAKPLKRAIETISSEGRRDEIAGDEEGVSSFLSDKLFRGVEGAVGPFAKLLGLDGLDKDLYERTQRHRDADLSSAIASGAGMVAPLLGASVLAGPAAGALLGASAETAATTSLLAASSVIGAQSLGFAKDMYKRSIEATGDEDKALMAAGLTVASQAVMLVPLGKATSGLAGFITKQLGRKAVEEGAAKTVSEAILKGLEAQKKTWGNVARSTLEAGAAGSAGAIINNIGSNIGLDQNGDITHGAANAFLANAVLGGVITGGHALLENAVINQARKTFTDIESKLAKELPPKPKEGEESKPERAQFYKDPEGYYVPREDPPTFEERVENQTKARKEEEDYIDSPLPDSEGKMTDETGEPVDIPSHTDIVVENRPEGTVLVTSKEALRPGRFLSNFFKKLGAHISLNRNVVDGAFGAFYTDSNKIKLLRSLGADPETLNSTLAHEGTHFLDKLLNNAFIKSPTLKSTAEKLLGLKEVTMGAVIAKELKAQAKDISMKWRPGWDGVESKNLISTDPLEKFRAYRSEPTEIYADVGDAIWNDPAWVKEKYPEVYSAFEKGLARDKTINQFWKDFQEMENDPNKLSEFNLQIAKEARIREEDINVAAKKAKKEKDSFQNKMKRDSDLSYQMVFDKISPARQIVKNLVGKARQEGFQLLNEISRRGHLGPYLERVIDTPLKQLWDKFLQSKIDPNMWAQYEFANDVETARTPTMERVKENPELYFEVAKFIKEFLRKEKGIKPIILDKYFNLEKIKTADDLNAAFAGLGIVGDTADLYQINYFLGLYKSDDPLRGAKAARRHASAVASLNRKKESIPIENLKAFIDSLPTDKSRVGAVPEKFKEALQDVTTANAFAVRKYLINEGAYNVYDAGRDIAYIQNTLGPEKFSELKKFHEEFHNILAAPLDIIERSGIFSPDTIARIHLNKGNYITHNMLSNFEGNDAVSGSIRSAIGSLGETGNELTATPTKIKAITARAYWQNAVNASIKIADNAGLIKEITRSKPGVDVFALKDRLSRGDKEHSYLIGYTEGRPSLYKIAGGEGFGRMFESQRDFSGIFSLLNPVLSLSDAFNKSFLTRQLKTVFSPGFVVGQKFYDRALEKVLANSLQITFGLPIQVGKLRANDVKTVAELRHYQKTGELTGRLKEIVDLDGVTLRLATLFNEGISTERTYEDTVYQSFSNRLPDEKSALEKLGFYTEKALDKAGGAWLKQIAEFDEIRTKVNGYRIGKEMLDMSDAEAAVFARDNFGVPDPLGGGIAAPALNRMFLFGAAHAGGLRVLKTLLKDMPKTAATQVALRVLLPKLMLSTVVMYPVIKALSNEEDAQKYMKWLNMTDRYSKMSKNVMPLGFQDGQGNYHNFWGVDNKDIQSDWKAWGIGLPQSRELTIASKAVWPFIEHLFEGDPLAATGGAIKGAASSLTGGIQPAIQYMINIGQLSLGYNPTDFFRGKGILDRDVAQGTDIGLKAKEYGKYFLGSQYSGIAPYNPFQTTKPKSIGEEILQKPIIGPFARRLTFATNYGSLEKTADANKLEDAVKANIITSTGEKTKEILQEYRNAAGAISKIGKGWQKEMGPSVAHRTRMLTSWHSKVWLPLTHKLQDAQEAGDSEHYNYLLDTLERQATHLLEVLDRTSSTISEKPKEGQE